MMADSRKAKRDSFASQRARLHFASQPLVLGVGVLNGRPKRSATRAAIRRDIVREGLIGFVHPVPIEPVGMQPDCLSRDGGVWKGGAACRIRTSDPLITNVGFGGISRD
jgi:hypothetical protein